LVAVVVRVAVGVEGCGIICRAETFGRSAVPVMNWITICPPLGDILLKTSSKALFPAPAVPTMSKLDSTVTPLIVTLNILLPAVV
jgi:hypothetical protein